MKKAQRPFKYNSEDTPKPKKKQKFIGFKTPQVQRSQASTSENSGDVPLKTVFNRILTDITKQATQITPRTTLQLSSSSNIGTKSGKNMYSPSSTYLNSVFYKREHLQNL